MPILSRISRGAQDPPRSLWQTSRVADIDRQHCPGAHTAESRLRNSALEGNVAGIHTALLESGANINGTNEHGQTALHRAAERGHVNALQALRERGADVTLKDKEGKTALQVVEACGHIKALKRSSLWPAPPPDVHWSDISQRRLRTCAQTGDLEGVREQLAMGVNVLSTNEDRKSAIDLAELAGHQAIAALLTEVAEAQRSERRFVPEPRMQPPPTTHESYERSVRSFQEKQAKYEADLEQWYDQRDQRHSGFVHPAHVAAQREHRAPPSVGPGGMPPTVQETETTHWQSSYQQLEGQAAVAKYEAALRQYERDRKQYNESIRPDHMTVLAARRESRAAPTDPEYERRYERPGNKQEYERSVRIYQQKQAIYEEKQARYEEGRVHTYDYICTSQV